MQATFSRNNREEDTVDESEARRTAVRASKCPSQDGENPDDFLAGTIGRPKGSPAILDLVGSLFHSAGAAGGSWCAQLGPRPQIHHHRATANA